MGFPMGDFVERPDGNFTGNLNMFESSLGGNSASMGNALGLSTWSVEAWNRLNRAR